MSSEDFPCLRDKRLHVLMMIIVKNWQSGNGSRLNLCGMLVGIRGKCVHQRKISYETYVSFRSRLVIRIMLRIKKMYRMKKFFVFTSDHNSNFHNMGRINLANTHCLLL